jgi:hypothetical protein
LRRCEKHGVYRAEKKPQWSNRWKTLSSLWSHFNLSRM